MYIRVYMYIYIHMCMYMLYKGEFQTCTVKAMHSIALRFSSLLILLTLSL